MENALFSRANLQNKYNVTLQKTSSGHFQPRRLQGLRLRVSYISWAYSPLTSSKGLPFEKKSRRSPLVFSSVPLSQGWCSRQKKTGP